MPLIDIGGLQASARQPAVARRSAAKVTCSAEQRPVQAASKVVGAGLLAAAISLSTVQSASAEDLFYSDANISGLTKCADNKGFQKRQKSEVKALQKRLKQVSSSCKPRQPNRCCTGPTRSHQQLQLATNRQGPG